MGYSVRCIRSISESLFECSKLLIGFLVEYEWIEKLYSCWIIKERRMVNLKKCIVLLFGDGIGFEVLELVIDVLKSVVECFNYEFEFEYGLIGGVVIDEYYNFFLEEIVVVCKNVDVILFGVVGGLKWD